MVTLTEMTISSSLGAVMLLLLSYSDFRQRVLKPTQVFRYYAAFALFAIVNLTIYFALCTFFLQLDPISTVQMPEQFSGRHFTQLQLMQPILISLMYFGTGLAKFKIGDREIDIYQRFLSIFQSLLAIRFTEAQRIRDTIEGGSAERGFLDSKIAGLRAEAERRHWDVMEEKWKDINQDIDMLQSHANYLSSIDSKLGDPVTHDTVQEIKKDVESRISEIGKTQLIKLKRYYAEFIIKNFKDEAVINQALSEFIGQPPPAPPEPNYVIRCATICGLFGLFVGPIYAATAGLKLVTYSWYGAISLLVFGLVFSVVRSAKRNVTDFLLRAVICGGLAGAASHLTWMWLRSGSVPVDLEKLVFGIEYGAALAVLIYVFRIIGSRLPAYLNYIAIGVGGAAVFVGLGVINGVGNRLTGGDHFPHVYLLLILLGAVVTLGLTVGLNVFGRASQPRAAMAGKF